MPGILRIMQPLQRPLTLPMHGKGMPRMRLDQETPHTIALDRRSFNEKYLYDIMIYYIYINIYVLSKEV